MNGVRILIGIFLLFLGAARAQEPAEPREPQAGTSPLLTSFAEAQEAYDEANALYEQEQFDGALARYLAAARAGFGTREIWGNAGNASYRLGDVGHAILYYKRALKADPDYNQARENIESIQPTTNIVEEEGLGGTILRAFRFTPTWLFVVLCEVGFVWLLISIILLGRTAPATEKRSLWLSRTAGGVIFFLVAYGVLLAHGAMRDVAADAVVIQDKVITRQGPGDEFFQQLELPAGTLLNLRDEIQSGYVRFSLLDGRSGYISVSAVERI